VPLRWPASAHSCLHLPFIKAYFYDSGNTINFPGSPGFPARWAQAAHGPAWSATSSRSRVPRPPASRHHATVPELPWPPIHSVLDTLLPLILGHYTPPPFNLSLTSLNDEGLGPNLPRGRGKSIGGDLDVSEEGSEQMIITLQSLHHGSIRYQHVRTGVGLAKKAKFL
jgi:hypothetical protein